MVVRAVVVLFFLSPTAFAAKDLSPGRAALARGDTTAALAAYKAIGPQDREWKDKLEDLARFHVNQNDGALEAWRVLQVGRRTRIDTPEWNDLERLAVLKSHGCPLALPAGDDRRGHLLNAATYRLLPEVFQAPETLSTEDGQAGRTHLAAGLTPYLQDIAQMEIARGRGCRAARVLARKSLERSELNELLPVLPVTSALAPEGLLIRLRALELARRTGETALSKQLRDSFPPPSTIPWLSLTEGERQWLFVQLFNGSQLEGINEKRRGEAEQIALLIFNGADDASPLWLAAINLSNKTATERQALFTRAQKQERFEGRNWVLLELAIADAELNQTSAALTVIRRLLVEREEPLDGPMEDAAISLAAKLFAEHRLDERTQGALEAALPSRMWSTLVSEALLHAAIEGRANEFAKLVAMQDRLHKRYGPMPMDLRLQQAMARRDLRAFRAALPARGYGLEARLIAFAQTLARAEYDDVRGSDAVFRRELANRLSAITYPGTLNGQEMADLIVLLRDGKAKNEHDLGARSVRQGVVKVGIARWNRPQLRPAEFALEPPATLPRRDLYYVPDTASARGWVFSSVVR